MQIRKKINSEDQPPQRPTDEAFDNLDELRTVDEMRDILADRHRVKLNSLIGNYIDIRIGGDSMIRNTDIFRWGRIGSKISSLGQLGWVNIIQTQFLPLKDFWFSRY